MSCIRHWLTVLCVAVLFGVPILLCPKDDGGGWLREDKVRGPDTLACAKQNQFKQRFCRVSLDAMYHSMNSQYLTEIGDFNSFGVSHTAK